MNRAHPNFGLKTKIGYTEWWRRVVIGKYRKYKYTEYAISLSQYSTQC
jgi:hypothetical protein